MLQLLIKVFIPLLKHHTLMILFYHKINSFRGYSKHSDSKSELKIDRNELSIKIESRISDFPSIFAPPPSSCTRLKGKENPSKTTQLAYQ